MTFSMNRKIKDTSTSQSTIKKSKLRTGEVAQWLGVQTALLEDLLTSTFNSSSMESITLDLHWCPHAYGTSSHRHMLISISKLKIK